METRQPLFSGNPAHPLRIPSLCAFFFETCSLFAFDPSIGAWDTEKTYFMTPKRLFLTMLCASAVALPALAQNSAPTPAPAAESSKVSSRADAYFNFTMGHIYEQQYEQTGAPEYATRAIEAYKKAYAIDPQSPIIGERLAEMYWKAQRQHDAITEANQILKNNPDDLATHRLLALVYLREVGDLNGANVQGEKIDKAIQEYAAVHRLDPSDQEATIWLVRLYRLHNEPDKAEQVLRGLLKDDPENDAGVEQLTQLLLDENKSQEAVDLLNDLIKRSPSATLYDHLGDAYTQTHDFAKAEEAYRKAVDLDPSDLSHLRGLGQTLLSEEKYPEALTVYQKLSELLPDDADTYLRIAQIYRELHQLDKAEENLVKARQFAPGSLEVMYNEAMIYESQGRFDDAIRVLSDAVTGVKSQSRVMPSRRRSLAILYQQLGMLYRDTQNYQAAIYTFQELGHLGDEEDARSRLLIMDTYRQARDLPKALQAGKDALAKFPDDSAICNSYAMLLAENQQPDEAIKLLQTSRKGAAPDRETYLAYSQIYERSHRMKEAEEAARKAESLGKDPADNEMAWLMLGAIYEHEKQYDKAEEEFKKVLDVNPRNAITLNYYGYMLAERGIRLDEARDLVQRALDQDPYNGAYLDSLGWTYYKQNKLDEAELTLRKALERESHDPTIRQHLGDVLAKQGRMEPAVAEWEKSLAEWHRSLPADLEEDKVAEVEKKLNDYKHRVAQKTPAADAKP
jgi:tetratricopeptide (TPR) repeat protein